MATRERLGLAPDDPRWRTLRVLNPVKEEEARLRSSLVPSLLRLARQNLDRQVDPVRIFEVSRVFRPREEPEPPAEPLWLAGLLTAPRQRRLWDAAQPAAALLPAQRHRRKTFDRAGLYGIVAGRRGRALPPSRRSGGNRGGRTGDREPRRTPPGRGGALRDRRPVRAARARPRARSLRAPRRAGALPRGLALPAGPPRSRGLRRARAARRGAARRDREDRRAAICTRSSSSIATKARACPRAASASRSGSSSSDSIARSPTPRWRRAIERVVRMLSHRFGGELR